METSIKIREETHKNLNLMKYNLNLKSIDEVITYILNQIPKLNKLGGKNDKVNR